MYLKLGDERAICLKKYFNVLKKNRTKNKKKTDRFLQDLSWWKFHSLVYIYLNASKSVNRSQPYGPFTRHYFTSITSHGTVRSREIC